MPVFPLDETLSSEQARARIDTLRHRAEHLVALRNAASSASLEASQTYGEIEAELARAAAAERGPREAQWRPRQTMFTVSVHAPMPPARVAQLRELARQWKERATELRAQAGQLNAQIVELTGEANILEARQAERFRTGLLLSPSGSILPPRMVAPMQRRVVARAP